MYFNYFLSFYLVVSAYDLKLNVLLTCLLLQNALKGETLSSNKPMRIHMTAALTNNDCTAVCHSSAGEIVAGHFHGQIEVYNKSNQAVHSCTTSGAVWSICEQDETIYAQCGDRDIEVWSCDLKRALKKWSLNFLAGKIAVVGKKLYASDPTRKLIAQYSASSGELQDHLQHSSFVYPYIIKGFRKDSIIICDGKADSVFMFKNGLCIWQINMVGCSGIASNRLNDDIWVKRLNRSTLTVLTPNGR